MRFFDLLIMSVNNLRRRKLRTGLTVLGVVIGTASIVVMVSLGIGLKEMTVEQYASYGSLTRIQVYQSYGMGGEQTEDSFLVDDTVLLFQQIPHVEAVSPQLSTYINMRQGIYTGSTNLVGLSKEALKDIPLAQGRLPDSNASTMELIVGNMVARDFYNSKTGSGYWDTNEMPDVDLWNDPFFVTFQSMSMEETPQKKYIFPVCAMVDGGETGYGEYSYGIYTDIELLKEQLRRVYRKNPIPGQPTNSKGKPYSYFVYDSMYVYVDDMDHVTEVQEAINNLGYQTYSSMEWLEQAQEQTDIPWGYPHHVFDGGRIYRLYGRHAGTGLKLRRLLFGKPVFRSRSFGHGDGNRGYFQDPSLAFGSRRRFRGDHRHAGRSFPGAEGDEAVPACGDPQRIEEYFCKSTWKAAGAYIRLMNALRWLSLKTFLQPLSAREERECLKRYKEGDQEAREILINRNMRLVAHVIKKYQSPDYEMEDLLSVGTIGLIKAVNTFDPNKGSRLATYAAKCVENEILMLFRAGKKFSREVSIYDPIGTDKDGETVSLLDILEAEGKEALEQVILKQDIRMLYEAYEQNLKDTEKTVIRMRYGLFGSREHTQREIADEMGISRSYVSRIEKRAIEKLKAGFL